MNIYDYLEIDKRGCIKEIDIIDALVFARLSYIHIENIKDKIPFSISELAKMNDLKINHYDKKLLDIIKNNRRYMDLKIIRCESVLEEEKEEQFMAITIDLRNSLFIAFRGTDKSLIGYMEDLNMSFMRIPSQLDAVNYLNNEKTIKDIYLGGHSKGGNLSMYAAANANLITRGKIKKIFNFDGPGFLTIDNKFIRIKNKIVNYFPECSFVGTLMYNDSNINFVKVLKEGIKSHNLYNWEIDNGNLKLGVQRKESIDFHNKCLEVINGITINKRKIIINYIYELMLKGKIKNLNELTFEDVKLFINNVPKLNESDKKLLQNFMKSLMKCLI